MIDSSSNSEADESQRSISEETESKQSKNDPSVREDQISTSQKVSTDTIGDENSETNVYESGVACAGMTSQEAFLTIA